MVSSLRWTLAALSVGAGAIHFAVSGEHFDVSWVHGTFFAVVAWAQLAWALAVVLRPDRRLLFAAIGLNVAILGVWAVSRTIGIPFGPESGEVEPVSLADGLASGFEAALVLCSAALLLGWELVERALGPTAARSGAALTALTVAVGSTVALTPSFATDHHGGGREDQVALPSGPTPCEQAGVAFAGNSGGGHAGHGGGGRKPMPWQALDGAARDQLSAQLAAADAVIQTYPTVQSAEAAGYRRASVYLPCIAAHYRLAGSTPDDPFDPAQPEMILYSGNDPDSEVIGLAYLVTSEGQPEGFAGPNDVWHGHEHLCVGTNERGEDLLLGIETASDEECASWGGYNMPFPNLWMLHLWNVPAWPSRWGLFSGEHPDLGGRVGDMNAPPDPEVTSFEDLIPD